MREEHKNNVKELKQQVEDLTLKLKLKDDSLANQISSSFLKDKDI